MQTMKKKNQQLTTDGENLATYIYIISQQFSAFIPTNTSQLNQHAHVQKKKPRKLMKMQTKRMDVLLIGLDQLSQSCF